MININSLRYCIRQSRFSLARNFWLAMVAAAMIAVSLAILGGFLLIAVNASHLLRDLGTNVEMSVFLEDGADLEKLGQQLDSLEGVQGRMFVSREQGLEEFSRSLGARELFSDLAGENNPLPDVFRIRASRAELLPVLAREIEQFPGVEAVDYGEELVRRLVKITSWLNSFFLGISLLLAAGAVFLVVTTIRLSVMARAEEISVMKYLGASNWFIRFPFLLEGMAMGWMGTLAAVLALGLTYYRLAAYLRREALAFFLQPVTDLERIVPVFVGLLILGTFMGGIGSFVSVRKFLRV